MARGHARDRAAAWPARRRVCGAGVVRQQRHQRVEQLRLAQRLGQVRGEQRSSSPTSRRPSELNSTSGSVAPASRMRRASVDAVHLRHVHVEDREVEGARRVEPVAAPRAGDSVSRGSHAPLRRLQREDAPVGGVVVDDQHALALQRRLRADEVAPRAVRQLGALGASDREDGTSSPCPGPSLSTHIVPPISSASRLLIARPRPVPPYLRVVDESACENDWNSRLMPSAYRPMPVSRTANVQLGSPFAVATVTVSTTSPSSVNFTALRQQVEQDLAQPRDVAVDGRGHVALEHIGDVEVLLGGARC